MKFRQYSYGKKSMDNFLNKIKETFGDMNLTKWWIEKQQRPPQFQISSFTSSSQREQEEQEKVRPS